MVQSKKLRFTIRVFRAHELIIATKTTLVKDELLFMLKLWQTGQRPWLNNGSVPAVHIVAEHCCRGEGRTSLWLVIRSRGLTVNRSAASQDVSVFLYVETYASIDLWSQQRGLDWSDELQQESRDYAVVAETWRVERTSERACRNAKCWNHDL